MKEISQCHPQLSIKEAAIAKSPCASKNIVNAIRSQDLCLPADMYLPSF